MFKVENKKEKVKAIYVCDHEYQDTDRCIKCNKQTEEVTEGKVKKKKEKPHS